MLLLAKLLHVGEGLAVRVDVVQHVSVLVATQPLILPVEAQCAFCLQIVL